MPSLYDHPLLFIIHSPLVPQIYTSFSGFTRCWTRNGLSTSNLAALLSPSGIEDKTGMAGGESAKRPTVTSTAAVVRRPPAINGGLTLVADRAVREALQSSPLTRGHRDATGD
ncbi:hypothetical protein E2C01_049629 [Portunus trituberculatus]|uniref:Uncharacterized protein n=1 Tax=Portunus trituberculatus TaxID=210409 RepID=A0A5B7GGK5_PORTR|nr:hypothetical protein [Portunus trituberculatus]